MCLVNYKSLIVNICVLKWLDNKFWIRVKNYEVVKYIVDVVYYYIGCGFFYFYVMFYYLFLCLSNCDLFIMKEMCVVYVGRIVKVFVLSRECKDYKECVKKFVFKFVNSFEVVIFLRSLFVIFFFLLNFGGKFVFDGKFFFDGNEVVISEEERYFVVIEDGEQGMFMEVDVQSEEVIFLLFLVVCVDLVNFFYFLQMNLFGDIDILIVFVLSFGMNLDENILYSEGQSIIFGYCFLKEYIIFGNLEGFFNFFDEGE